MNSLWRTFGWDRAEARARSEALVRQTRDTGAKLLSRVASGARTIQHTLRGRRERLEREPRQDLERRILAGLELVLERLGWGLRSQSDRLRTREPEPTFEANATEMPTEAEIVRTETPPTPQKRAAKATRAPSSTPAAPKKGSKKRIRVSALAPSLRRPLASKEAASKENSERPRAKSDGASRSNQKSGRVSTRWVSAPKVDLDALMLLSAKELVAKIPALEPETCRALLAREKAAKNRKTVMEALSARLPS